MLTLKENKMQTATETSFSVGDSVRVVSCDQCPGVVDKIGVVKEVTEAGFKVSFGKGRPQKGRPEVFSAASLSLVNVD